MEIQFFPRFIDKNFNHCILGAEKNALLIILFINIKNIFFLILNRCEKISHSNFPTLYAPTQCRTAQKHLINKGEGGGRLSKYNNRNTHLIKVFLVIFIELIIYFFRQMSYEKEIPQQPFLTLCVIDYKADLTSELITSS